jgi:predicted amidohydrolase
LPQWKLATSARALDNQIWLVAANRIGADNKFTYFGRSRTVSPYGDSVVECGEREEVAVATVDGKVTEEFKGIVNFLKDRQPLKN